MDFISIFASKTPPPSGEGDRVAVVGAIYMRARQSAAAFAALFSDSLSVTPTARHLSRGERIGFPLRPTFARATAGHFSRRERL